MLSRAEKEKIVERVGRREELREVRRTLLYLGRKTLVASETRLTVRE